MEYKALVSFSGAISMSRGEVREIGDPVIVNDLLKAGYIHPVGPPSGSDGSSIRGREGDSKLADKEPSKAGLEPARAAGQTDLRSAVQRSAGVKKKGGKKKNVD